VVCVSLAKEFWMAKSCWKGYKKCEPRDKVVVVEGESVVRYFLWGSQIASWNKVEGTLFVDDCHWKTPLTFRRLNSILAKFGLFIHSERGVSYLVNSNVHKEYVWEGAHLIHLESLDVQRGVLRKTNPKASQSLQKYYASAVEVVAKCRQLTVQTLSDEVVCLIPNLEGARRFHMPLLGLYVNDDILKGYVNDEVACSKVYSAFMKNNVAVSLADYLATKGEELTGQEILTTLQTFNVKTTSLHPKILQQLAFLKLVEA